jgi:hypothetical protein
VEEKGGRVRIRFLSGNRAGAEQEVPQSTDPLEAITFCVQQGWAWEVVWASARDAQETFLWARADLVGRILRALREGRPVYFNGVRYAVTGPDPIGIVAGQVEDAIVNSGANVKVGTDDEDGVVIEILTDEVPGSSSRN